MYVVKRSEYNPILSPTQQNPWETFAAFNWSPVVSKKDKNTIHCVYRAIREPNLVPGNGPHISCVGYASSKDGIHYTNRSPLIQPEFEWEKYGCEDPRITELNGKFYIFYTALSVFPFNYTGIKVACAITKDFKKIDAKYLITPFNAKAMALFPSKINGKFTALLTVNTDNRNRQAKIALAQFNKEEDIWNPVYWENWYKDINKHILHVRRTITDHVEIGAAPLRTKYGWLVVYAHIQNYPSEKKIFGVEIILLDFNNPKKVIGRTKHPLFVVEEAYEKYGQVPNVIFPSGSLIRGEDLWIFYGASDTTSCVAKVNLDDLLDFMCPPKKSDFVVRYKKNPIISPIVQHPWESRLTFNPAAIELGGKIHILYRAMSMDNTSSIGYASSTDGLNIDERLPDPIYTPREEFEMKKIPNGNSGCEDPRIVRLGNMLYMCYTAYNGVEVPRVALTTISVNSFLKKQWNWSKPILISPPNFDDKDACIFPEKVNGRYLIIHRIRHQLCMDFVDSLDGTFEEPLKGTSIIRARYGMWDSKKLGLAGPPIKTKAGWLLFYHGIGEDSYYRMGAVLLDLKNPLKVLSRTTESILEPEKKYEKEGEVPNVVFPCGHVCRGDIIYHYYGGADSVVGVAAMKLSKLLSIMK